MTTDPQRFRQELTDHLDWFAERGRKVRFWWRDDDAIEPTPALERMLSLANNHDVDVAFAVIPKMATKSPCRTVRRSNHMRWFCNTAGSTRISSGRTSAKKQPSLVPGGIRTT